MPVTSKPAQGHTNWTTGLNTQVQDPGSKKTTGWIADDIPPFEFENWLQWTLDQWEQYFEYITDLHTTQIAALTTTVGGLGTASNITASNSGHTTLTGTNVQVQLDQTDAALKDLYDTVTSGLGIDLVGYDPTAPGNWSPAPTHAGPALDQLAARMKVVEAATGGANYDDKTFFDYIIPADSPIGAGNTGLTDTNLTNPRGIKLAASQLLFGEERVYIKEIRRTGNYDANGLPEWAPCSPKFDGRVRFYGSWNVQEISNFGYLPYTAIAGDYILITGVFDGVQIMAPVSNVAGNQHDVWVDGVDTSTNFSQRGQQVTQWNLTPTQKYFNSQMIGLTQDLHTVKIVCGSSDSNTNLLFNGVNFINTLPKELAAEMYIQKVQTSLAQNNSPTLGTATANGGYAARYLDRGDSSRKDVISNSYNFQTAVTGSLGSGATSFSVNSASGLGSNNLLLIQDSSSNSEIVLATSVNVISGAISIAGSGLRNSYTNPTVSFYGRIMAATNHSNEKSDRRRNYLTMGVQSNASFTFPSMVTQAVQNQDGQMEDGGTRLAFQDGYSRNGAWIGANGPLYQSLNQSGYNLPIIYEFFGTGLDVLIDTGTAGAHAGLGYIYVDGVLITPTNYAYPNNTTYWLKICSDLPLGHHVVQFIDNSNTLGGYQYGFIEFQEYSPKQSSIELALSPGDLLSYRNIPASYVWNNNPANNVAIVGSALIFGISKGVVRHTAIMDSIFTGTGWSIGQSISGYQNGYLIVSDTTSDKVTKSFFGTGVDLCYQASTAYGIAQIQIDGLNATPANFPGSNFQGLGYNSSTGTIDMYNSAVLQANVSFAGISSTPKWHTITMTVTGTKNVSSSDTTCLIACWDIHGASHNPDAILGIRPQHSNQLGGVNDKRTLSYDGHDVLGNTLSFSTRGNSGTYGCASGDDVTPDGMCADMYLPYDAEVELSAWATLYNPGSGDRDMGPIVVDGIIADAASNGPFSQGNTNNQFNIGVYTLTLRLKKGWHNFASQISFGGSATLQAYGNYRAFSAKVLPSQRNRNV